MVSPPLHPRWLARPRTLLLAAPEHSPAAARAAQLAARWQAAVVPLPDDDPDAIAAEVARATADLIIADGLSPEIERLACASPRPLLAVKTPPAGPHRKLLVAVDHSARGARSLDLLQAFPDAAIELVHAYHLPFRDVVGADPALPAGLEHTPTPPPLALRGFRVDNRLGTPEKLLVEAVTTGAHDLAIVATHGAHDLGVSLIGRTAAALLAGLPCDVLMVPTADRR
ncbi:universal stress protein [Sphingoaurantiacus capsulatus]|uniref:Universal stress protein n=1 Tax=Sphingoaurantiacus capsulatus TaxID=1771310 RepID=A0ABV7X589_9SPHN